MVKKLVAATRPLFYEGERSMRWFWGLESVQAGVVVGICPELVLIPRARPCVVDEGSFEWIIRGLVGSLRVKGRSRRVVLGQEHRFLKRTVPARIDGVGWNGFFRCVIVIHVIIDLLLRYYIEATRALLSQKLQYEKRLSLSFRVFNLKE